MTANELRARLAELGLSQSAFARLLTDYAEDARTVDVVTVNRWTTGKITVPPAVAALVTVLCLALDRTDPIRGIVDKYR